jgi:hypothetical protein
MRAPPSSPPLLVAALWLAGAGCASRAPEEPAVASKETACANAASSPLQMTSSSSETKRDPEIESMLSQQTSDRHLAEVNRRMYQSLRSLDVELRRQQRIAACERPWLNDPPLEARSAADSGRGPAASAASPAAGGGTAVPASAAVGTGLASGGAVGGGRTQSPTASGSAAASGVNHPGTLRKTRPPATGGGGNGAAAEKVSTGSDNDIVARRLRKAAEQETDPTLRAKLWKEYTDYRRGASAK